jgi:hypothetical protein
MNRHSTVMANATFLRSNRNAMNAHLRKSKACANKTCSNPKCGFYHSRDDYRPPVCIYEEFCHNNYCTMFHPQLETMDSYISRTNVLFPQSNPRRDEVMANAQLLKNDKNAMSEHLRKSKVCTNVLCKKNDDCGFAHSIDDYKPPVCIYQEFCESESCMMFHPHHQTIDEYMTIHKITFESSSSPCDHSCHRAYPDGAFTKMCNLMTADEPCPRDYCTYAHSIYELRLPEEMVCYDYHDEKDEKCLKFHPSQCKCCPHDALGRRDGQICHELLQFVISLGYTIEPWMTRHPSVNRLMYAKLYQTQQKLIDELRELEEMGETLSSSISIGMTKLSIKA